MENTAEDIYRTLEKPSKEVVFKDRKSKFYGYAFPLDNEFQVKEIMDGLRKKHPTANHVCYAWRLGVEEIRYRANDDGEPNNTAGTPIYGQIQSFDVTFVLVAVARIFGGTKLGVGGLVHAYRSASFMALESSVIVTKLLRKQFQLHFGYPEMDKVMRIIKQQRIEIISQEMRMDCSLLIAVRKTEASRTMSLFKGVFGVTIVQLGEDSLV